MRWPFFRKKQETKIHLCLNYIEDACEMTSWVKDVHYSVLLGNTKVGECDLRLGKNYIMLDRLDIASIIHIEDMDMLMKRVLFFLHWLKKNMVFMNY